MKNYYDLLGVNRTCSPEQIKAAYRKLSMKFHPDKNSGEVFFSDMFRQVNEAYQVLSDPNEKRKYDSKLAEFENPEKVAQKAYKDAQSRVQEQLFREKVRLQAEAKRTLDAERQRLQSQNSHSESNTNSSFETQVNSRANVLKKSLNWWRGCRNFLLIINLILGVILLVTKNHTKSNHEPLFNARVNSRNGLRLRQTASATAETVDKIPYYETVKVLRTDGPIETFRNYGEHWYFIEYKGKTGWIWGGYLTKEN